MEKFSILMNLNITNIYNLSKYDIINLEKSIHNNDYKLLITIPIFNFGVQKKIANYTYFEHNDLIYHYYHTNIFFDINNKIIINTNQICTSSVEEIIKLLIRFLQIKTTFNLDNCIGYENIITIQKFNTLYGHLKDEMFGLADFYEKYNDPNFLPLINYPNNDYYKNIIDLDKIIFNKVINPEYNKIPVIKIKKLIIVEHQFNLDTFHLFPKNITTKIISHYKNDNIETGLVDNNNKIFLTRDKITWIDHNINNNLELINISKKKNFVIINPETITMDKLINYLKKTDTLIISFGSALVNLIYTKLGCNVIIIKSNSYKTHNINIFRNLIKNYNINYKIITCDDNNNIDPNIFDLIL
jgi:hypothetical protein